MRRERELQEQRLAVLRRSFDRMIYSRNPSEDDARLDVETALAKRIDHLCRAAELLDRQRRKLEVAGRGDVKRLFDRAAEARRGLEAIGDQQAAFLEIRKAGMLFTKERQVVESGGGPLLAKTIAQTLTEEQRAAFEKDADDRRDFRHRAAVRWTAVLLARNVGLLDDQRRRLEAVLMEDTRPPIKFESFDYWIVMYQAARIPEARIRPILDELQWRVLTQEFATAQEWGPQLKRSGVFPEHMFDQEQDGAFPAIRFLQEFDANISRP